MEILNLTPHPVNIINGEGVMTATFPVAGPAPRLAELVESLPAVDGLPVNKVRTVRRSPTCPHLIRGCC